MEKKEKDQLHYKDMITERRLRWTCSSLFGQWYGQTTSFCYEDTQSVQPVGWSWMHYAMRDVKDTGVDTGVQMGYRSLEWNWQKG